jgi:hypothetical protein
MKARIEQRRRTPKLPPILEIDEDGVPVSEVEMFERPRWSSDGEEIGVQMGDWPTEFDD